jgi:beta-lactamase superfamily II metal-dependent hydrolase
MGISDHHCTTSSEIRVDSLGSAEAAIARNRIHLSAEAMRAVLLCCLFAALPALAAAQEGPRFTVRPTAAPCLLIRAAPEPNGGRIDCLPPGTAVVGLQAAPYWRHVQTAEGTVGWAAKKFLEPSSAIAAPFVPDGLPPDAWLEIHVVDVGQGDGIWITTHDDGMDGNGVFEGRNIVIDGGPTASDRGNEMLRYLRGYAHHDALIDALIVTHPHDDHYPGAEGILRHFEVLNYYDPGFPKERPSYAAFRSRVEGEIAGGRSIRAMFGREQFQHPDWGREVSSQFLYSYPGSDEGLGTRQSTIENNASIVLRVVYGDHSFLFMGDAEGKDRADPPEVPRYVEKILLETLPQEQLRSTVLKIGHHGSETSSTIPFIQAVDPGILIVSSGRRSYGGVFLPDATVLQRYCAQNEGILIYRTDHRDAEEGRTARTDQDGDHIIIRSNGRELTVTQFSNGREVAPQSCDG